MSFSGNLRQVAKTLLDTYGEPATFNRELVSGYDPVTSSATGTTNFNFTADVYPSNYLNNEIDGVTITTEDTRLIVDAFQMPEINDTVTFNSTTYRVLNVQQIRAQGTNVLYICQVRV